MTQDQNGGTSGKRRRGTAEPTTPPPPAAAQRMARARSQIVLVYAVIKNSPQRPYVHESKRSELSGCLSADVRNMYIVSTATLRRARPQRWSKARCVVPRPSLLSPRWICAAHTSHHSWEADGGRQQSRGGAGDDPVRGVALYRSMVRFSRKTAAITSCA